MSSRREFKILFAGDFAPCRRYEQFILDGHNPFKDIQDLIQNADISFVNVECPLTMCEDALPKSGPNIKASPRCASVLSPFTVAGLANNHVLDYKDEGVADTIKALSGAGLETVGAGSNIEEAKKIYYKTIDDVCVAIIAVAEQEFNIATQDSAGCAPLDIIDNFEQLRLARETADVVIITIHGGNEYLSIPRPGLRKLCRFFADNGADAVICHHPHVPGAYEVYNDKLIAYSIGNFVFDRLDAPKGWDEGYLVELSIDGAEKRINGFTLHPYKQSIELGGVQLMDGDAKQQALDSINSLRNIVETDELYIAGWNQFVERRVDGAIVSNYMPIMFRGVGLLTRKFGLSKFLINRRNRWARLNLVRCDSHRELLVGCLEKRVKS